MFANVFLILCAYYFIKPLREGWIAISAISELSAMEVKAYSSFGQSILLLFVVSAYSRLADRVSRVKLIRMATLFCMSNLVAFWFLQPGFFLDNLPGTGVLFYLWVGMFGVFIVAQFWAFAADLYAGESGDRLIPLIAIGATAGAASGSWITDQLVGSGLVSSEFLLIAALVPLAASILLTTLADADAASETTPDTTATETAQQADEPERDRRGALTLVLGNRYLLAVALITVLMNWVNTNGENLLFRVIQETLMSDAATAGVTGEDALRTFTRDGTTAFYGNFFFWVNIVALLLQAFLASRLLRYGGFAAVLLLLPVVALISYSTMAIIPILGIVKMMKIAENSTDYSINNTARHVIWLPVKPELKYKGKPTVDSLFARIGDGLAALTVLVGVHVLALETSMFFAFTVLLVALWLIGAVVVIREHRALVEHGQQPRDA
jgi:AAA family ATP:ADP antiporter